jgi:PAS domain-containing protein
MKAEFLSLPKHLISGDYLSAEALQELLMLQAEVSIPLIAHGELLGALNLGPKVTGAPFFAAELEILYILCGNVALALRDIDLHHQVINQKAYFENILQRMNSGVVAINCENRIITFNSRASALLQISREETMGKDLRLLPSPLGDFLYDTLTTGKEISKGGVYTGKGAHSPGNKHFPAALIPRGVLGSVMIFDDISERKQLEVERRQSDQLDVLNKFVSQLAHEIKNPMVAIQTFSELLREKYDDSSFREYFTYTVRQEVKRLNELVEQLIAFSSPLSYKYTVADIHEILDLGLLLLQEQGLGQETTVETSYCRERLSIRPIKPFWPGLFPTFFDIPSKHWKRVERSGSILPLKKTSLQTVGFVFHSAIFRQR